MIHLLVVVMQQSLVVSVESRVPQASSEVLEGARVELGVAQRREVKAQNVASELVQVAVVLVVDRVPVALDHITQDVQTLGGVELDEFTVLAVGYSGIHCLADSGFQFSGFLNIRVIVRKDKRHLIVGFKSETCWFRKDAEFKKII